MNLLNHKKMHRRHSFSAAIAASSSDRARGDLVRARMKIIAKGFRFAAILFFLFLSLCALSYADEPTGPAPAQGTKLTLPEQEELAKELFTIMVKTDKYDLNTFIALYNRVIKECPDTAKAQISLWRLSNLYLFSGDKPDYPKIVELMEHLIQRYPDSPYIPGAKQRLLNAYEKTGNMRKALLLYEEIFVQHPETLDDPKLAAFMLGYAKALAATGNSRKAVSVYNKVISFGDKAQDFIVDIAKDEVEKLGTK
jgi:tetratricopeptide (TPR) repeat protein